MAPKPGPKLTARDTSSLPGSVKANMREFIPHHVFRFLRPPPRQSARPPKVEGHRKQPRPCRRTLVPPCLSRANPKHLRVPTSLTCPQAHLRRSRVSKEGKVDISRTDCRQPSIQHARSPVPRAGPRSDKKTRIHYLHNSSLTLSGWFEISEENPAVLSKGAFFMSCRPRYCRNCVQREEIGRCPYFYR